MQGARGLGPVYVYLNVRRIKRCDEVLPYIGGWRCVYQLCHSGDQGSRFKV